MARSSRKLWLKDWRYNSLASSSVSPWAKPHIASGKVVPRENSLKSDANLPHTHGKESNLKCEVVKKRTNPFDKRNLKVQIKVGSENLSTQKNAEIYCGLGLVASPWSSLDEIPTTSEGQHGNFWNMPEESPTSILQIMASCPVGLLLSPLSEDLIHLNEKRKLWGKSESKPMNKSSIESSGMLENGFLSSRSGPKVLEQKKMKPSENYDAFSTVLTIQKNNGDQDDTSSLLKKDKDADIDTLGCEELVSNALRLPLLSSSEYGIPDPAKGRSTATIDALKDGLKVETLPAATGKEHMDSESAQDIGRVEKLGTRLGLSGKVSASEKENLIISSKSNSSEARKSLNSEFSDTLKQLVTQRGSDSEQALIPTLKKSSTEGERKPKGAHNIGPQTEYMPKNQLIVDLSMNPKGGKDIHADSPMSKNSSHDLRKDHKKGERYKDLFGDVEFEEDDSESISGEMACSGMLKGSQLAGKQSLSEYHNVSKEECNGRNSEKPHPLEKNHGLASSAVPLLGNGSNSEAPTGLVPLVTEDWVSCDKCQKWRLLPLGTNPKSLPDKWLCRMLTWLPGMNRCGIPEEETTNALKALYHSAVSVPAPASESQHDMLNNSAVTLLGLPSVDARHPDEERQNIAAQTVIIGRNKKHGSACGANSTDSSILSSISQVKNRSTSGRNINANRGTNLNIRSKRESDLDGSRASKRIEREELHFDDGPSVKVSCSSSSGLSENASGNDSCKDTIHKDLSGDGKKNVVSGVNTDLHVPGTRDDGLLQSSKCDDKDLGRKRKGIKNPGSQIHSEPLSSSGQHPQDSVGFMEELCESDLQKEKKAIVSKSGRKDTCGSKACLETDRKSGVTKDQHNGLCMSNTLAAECLRSDIDSAQLSVAANSNSSKVSGSHENKTSAQEVKGSPVQSVSSSSLRFSNADKAISAGMTLVGNHNSNSLTALGPRRFSGGEEDGGNDPTGMVKNDAILTVCNHVTDGHYECLCQSNQCTCEKHSSEQHRIEEKRNTDQSQSIGSQSNKSGKELSSCSKDNARTSASNLDENKIKASHSSCGSVDRMHLQEEKTKSRRNKFDKKSGAVNKSKKFIYKKETAGGTPSKVNEGPKINFGGHDNQDVTKSQDKKHNLQKEHEDEKLPMKTDQAEFCGREKSNSLPPLARVQTEAVSSLQPVSGSQKENSVNLAVDEFDNSDALKKPLNQRKKDEKLNGQPFSLRHPTQNLLKVRGAEAPSRVRRDSSCHAANNALKEAKDLKHLADRLKNSGSTESIGFYFQAALKFLNGASLLESGTGEGTKHNDMMHSIYSSTAKLCEFCAHEYEKSKDMAAAALAYKCMDVAYMRVVYSSHTRASRDRKELQTVLQIVPLGESPSSSASDVDNLNHQAPVDKATIVQVVGSPQASESYKITSRNCSGLLRVLNFAQDADFAMEASRKSRITFVAATSRLGETPHKEGICSLKKALEFNFQDVEGLLHLVRVAMEAISR